MPAVEPKGHSHAASFSPAERARCSCDGTRLTDFDGPFVESEEDRALRAAAASRV